MIDQNESAPALEIQNEAAPPPITVNGQPLGTQMPKPEPGLTVAPSTNDRGFVDLEIIRTTVNRETGEARTFRLYIPQRDVVRFVEKLVPDAFVEWGVAVSEAKSNWANRRFAPKVRDAGKTEREKAKRARHEQNKTRRAAEDRARSQGGGSGKGGGK